MDSINKNLIVCDGCNNTFHLDCLVKWGKTKLYKKCPICQRFIHSTIIINFEEKLLAYSMILNKLL